MRGQQLGTYESCSIVATVGLSVDYIVHLAADYMHSKESLRADKMKQAYRQMGVSIVSGAITTIGCGILLSNGNMIFFQTFGLFVVITISFAFLSSTLTFGALCHSIGPEQDFGKLPEVTIECLKALP